MSDLRCDSKKHGEAIDDHTIEVKCNSKFCGAVPGETIVLHRFDLKTETMSTVKFKELRSK